MPETPDLRTAARIAANDVERRLDACPVCGATKAHGSHSRACSWLALRAALAVEATEPPPDDEVPDLLGQLEASLAVKPRNFGAAFDACAAPQAIEHHIGEHRRQLRRLARELRWLEALLVERNEQIARGEWPPAKEATP